MIFRRSDAADITIIAVNVTDIDATVPFTPPAPGQWTERLDGQASFAAAPGQQVQLTIPSNYGRIWTLG
jgi:maltooligosyltrehalose trehalohydrolase